MAIGSLTLPIRQSAVIANDAGELVVIYDAQLPELEPDRLLIQTVAVAINQVDVKLSGAMATPRAGAGTDCAGIVLAIGSAVPTDTFKIGDRICAPVTPMNPLSPRDGAFAEYTAVVADFALKVPGNMSMECAASLGLGIATIGYALFRSLGIPGHPESPASKSPIVLVYGGSTSSGTMAIQLLRR
jgi:NADPH:quinone reductase-like Zn-dependent oxidoreductase